MRKPAFGPLLAGKSEIAAEREPAANDDNSALFVAIVVDDRQIAREMAKASVILILKEPLRS